MNVKIYVENVITLGENGRKQKMNKKCVFGEEKCGEMSFVLRNYCKINVLRRERKFKWLKINFCSKRTSDVIVFGILLQVWFRSVQNYYIKLIY